METQTTKVAVGSAAIVEGPDIVAAQGQLQTAITELVEFPYQPDTAAWVTKVSGAPTVVIAGAIAMWNPNASGGGAHIATDHLAPRREAALAILHARFAADQSRFATDTTRQTDQILSLTKVIAVLTGVMLLAVIVQVWLAVFPPR